jgi:hypothetical protein
VGSLRDGELEKFFGSDSSYDAAENSLEQQTAAGDGVDEDMKTDGEAAATEPQGGRLRGAEWFEDLLGGLSSGPLGRISRLGVRQTQDGGRRVVEWEIVEWSTSDGEERYAAPKGKRKIGEADMVEG